MIKVFLVDDHEVVRRGLADLLASDPELEIVGEAGSVSEAKARIPALEPDVAVLDVRLPDGNGIELCRDLLSRMPELRCLILTSFTSDEAMLDAILAGASGYIVKDIKGMELARAVKDVGAGRSLLDNRAAAALKAKLRGLPAPADEVSLDCFGGHMEYGAVPEAERTGGISDRTWLACAMRELSEELLIDGKSIVPDASRFELIGFFTSSEPTNPEYSPAYYYRLPAGSGFSARDNVGERDVDMPVHIMSPATLRACGFRLAEGLSRILPTICK